MRVAGYQGQLFSDGFLSSVHHHTKSVVRKINPAPGGYRALDQDDLKRVLLDLEGQIA